MKVYVKSIPLYFGFIKVVFTNNFNKANEKLNLKIKEDMSCFGAFVQGGRDEKKVSYYAAIFPKKPTHSMIAHEVVHVVNWILEDRRVKLDPFNDEAQAYLTGWVTKHVYKAAAKAGIEIK